MSRIEKRCRCKNRDSTNAIQYNILESALCVELKAIVEALSAPGKGILAADESPASLEERFRYLNLENSENTRRDYREMLFSSDKSVLSQYISGILLHHESLYQKTKDDVEFVELLRQKSIIPGIKVDKGLVHLFGTEGETLTQGLDDLKERCIQYKKDGCHFTKWRCVFTISDNLPSRLAINSNSHTLARYATICQSARLVPIVEPEILSQGDHSIEKAQEVFEQVLSTLFHIFREHHVYLEGIILKPAMVLPGSKSETCSPAVVAEHTVTALLRTVPPAVSTIFFLSGGQEDSEAYSNLNEINLYNSKKHWTLSFCFGRALQNEAMKVWSGECRNISMAQSAFLEKAKLSSLASLGKLIGNNHSEENANCTGNSPSDLPNLEQFVTSIEP